MTLKEYFAQGNKIYKFTDDQIKDLRAVLEAWERNTFVKKDQPTYPKSNSI